MLTDFGAAVLTPTTTKRCGTTEYAPPEAMHTRLDVSYDTAKADVWCLAVTIVASVMGTFPWDSATPSSAPYAAWSEAWATVRRARCATPSSPCPPSRAISPEVDGCDDHATAMSATLVPGPAPAPLTAEDISYLGTVLTTGGSQPLSAACIDLVVRMLDPDPDTRVGLAEVAQHPWLCAHPR